MEWVDLHQTDPLIAEPNADRGVPDWQPRELVRRDEIARPTAQDASGEGALGGEEHLAHDLWDWPGPEGFGEVVRLAGRADLVHHERARTQDAVVQRVCPRQLLCRNHDGETRLARLQQQ